MTGELLILIFLTWFVGIAAVNDVLSRRIPNKIIVVNWLLALALQSAFGGADAIQSALLGTVTGFALFIPFYAVKGMAAGDVKMMMVVGAFSGPALTLNIVLATFIFGGIGAVAVVLYNRKTLEVARNMRAILISHFLRAVQDGKVTASRDAMAFPSIGRMPYGPAIAIATITVLLRQ